MIDKKAVGERIRSIRLSMGMTTEEFSLIFNPAPSKGTVSKWEGGKYLPNPKRLTDIAFYGQISVDELLYNLDTNTSIMNEFIKFVEDSMLAEADEAFRSGETHFYSPEHAFAKEAAENFIIKLGGN